MNQHCECPLAGYCSRHKIHKSLREHALCRGIADVSDGGLKYWLAWEQGKLGATAPKEPILSPQSFCDTEAPLPAPRTRGCCGGRQKQKKTTVEQVVSYGKALTRWTLAGRPVRSSKETERIYRQICSLCEHFKPNEAGTAGACGLCGCRLSPIAPATENKIRMATECCPIGLWGAETSEKKSLAS